MNSDSRDRRARPDVVLPAGGRARRFLVRDDRRGGGRDASNGIGHDARRIELGRDSTGQVPVFSLDVTPDRVVPGEGPRAVGAGDPDALMALPDVSPKVRLVAVGTFAERTS